MLLIGFSTWKLKNTKRKNIICTFGVKLPKRRFLTAPGFASKRIKRLILKEEKEQIRKYLSDLFVRERAGLGRPARTLSQNKSNSYFNLVFFLFPPLNKVFYFLFDCRGCQRSSFWKLDTERTNYVFHIFPDFGIYA